MPVKLTSARTWLDRLDRSRHALWLLFVASMMETLIVPIPIETILIPWMLCYPYRKWTGGQPHGGRAVVIQDSAPAALPPGH